MPVVLVLSFSYLGDSFLRFPIILALIAMVVFVSYRFMLVPRKLWYKADVEASKIAGKDSLIASLRKMDNFEPSKTGKRRRTLLFSCLAHRTESKNCGDQIECD